MDPNILKSLQKIDELVKLKKDLLIAKPSDEPSITKPLTFPQQSAQINNINNNNNKNLFSDGIIVPNLMEENKGEQSNLKGKIG